MNGILKIEIDFELPVDLSDKQMQALDMVVSHICKSNCPEGWSFWPAGAGQKPIFSQADSVFLGKPVDPNAPPTGEPTWDNTVYQIECVAIKK